MIVAIKIVLLLAMLGLTAFAIASGLLAFFSRGTSAPGEFANARMWATIVATCWLVWIVLAIAL